MANWAKAVLFTNWVPVLVANCTPVMFVKAWLAIDLILLIWRTLPGQVLMSAMLKQILQMEIVLKSAVPPSAATGSLSSSIKGEFFPWEEPTQ
jgi:hypothetical protein